MFCYRRRAFPLGLPRLFRKESGILRTVGQGYNPPQADHSDSRGRVFRYYFWLAMASLVSHNSGFKVARLWHELFSIASQKIAASTPNANSFYCFTSFMAETVGTSIKVTKYIPVGCRERSNVVLPGGMVVVNISSPSTFFKEMVCCSSVRMV